MIITQIKHPRYDERVEDWAKWRRCYEGGEIFRSAYLKKFSTRESESDFELRREISPIPRFAGAAIDEIKNSIFQRMSDIGRSGGGKTYKTAVDGLNGGIDQEGSSMNMFIGQYVLPELLVMAKVGVYVDMPQYSGDTLAAANGIKPYVYLYNTEDIFSWSLYTVGEQTYYKTLLLRETALAYDEETGLAQGYFERYRRMWIGANNLVHVQYYDYVVGDHGQRELKDQPVIVLNMTKIPFVCFELNRSLIADICDYQIALLNMESSDINYSLNSNFPFYTEEYDPREGASHLKPEGVKTTYDAATQTTQISATGSKEIKIGTTQGRRRPKGLASPAFIHPSSEPLIASMKKQEQIKENIRTLLGLALSSVKAVHASADSKEQDKVGLESGLSYIGLELEHGERRLAEIWAEYMNEPKATINYPRKYALKTEAERRQEAKEQKELQGAAPSKQYQKEIAKQVAETMLSGKVSNEKLDAIFKEIEDAKYITSDADAITQDIENGLVTAETASTARGYDGKTEVPKALEEHAKKLAIIATSQSQGIGAARGSDPTNSDPKASKEEKKGKPQRGEGK